MSRPNEKGILLHMLELSSGTLQTRALIVLTVLTVISMLFFAVVAYQSTKDIPKERVATRGYALRKYWAMFVIGVLTVAGIVSFLDMPYPDSSDTTKRTRITLGTMQFGFIPNPASVPVGPVSMEVTALDVNHGVGVYSPDGVLISQVQAMPGKTNVLQMNFDKPGTYQLLCMEYCGLYHFKMLGAITVTGKDDTGVKS